MEIEMGWEEERKKKLGEGWEVPTPTGDKIVFTCCSEGCTFVGVDDGLVF